MQPSSPVPPVPVRQEALAQLKRPSRIGLSCGGFPQQFEAPPSQALRSHGGPSRLIHHHALRQVRQALGPQDGVREAQVPGAASPGARVPRVPPCSAGSAESRASGVTDPPLFQSQGTGESQVDPLFWRLATCTHWRRELTEGLP